MESIFKKGLIMALILSATVLKAQTWIGGGTDWNDPANWNPGLPTNGATITIDGLSATVDVISTFTPGQIDIINGGELIINSTLDVSGDSYTNITGIGSRLIINSGGLFTAEFIASTDNGSIKITGGELDVADQLSMTDGSFDITGGLLDYNGGVGEEMLLIDSDFRMTGGTLEFDRGIIVTRGTFSLEEGGTLTTTSSARNLEFHDANADIDGTINNPTGDLSLFGTSNIDILENASITLDDLVLNDDGTGSTLNIFGTIIVTDDLKFDEDPPDDFTGDNDQIIVKNGGTLTISDSFRDADLAESGNNIHAESGAVVHIEQLDGLTPSEAYGTLLTSVTGSTMTIGTGDPLPVELVSFDHETTEEGINLLWSTASESNNAYFEVLRSNDGSNFNPISRIEGHGNSNEVIEYSYLDKAVTPGTYFYQLKQVDYNGQFEYHQVILVLFSTRDVSSIRVFPNPVTGGNITIQSSNHLFQPDLKIYSLSGRLVLEKSLSNHNRWTLTINDLNLNPGTYILQLNDLATGQTFTPYQISVSK